MSRLSEATKKQMHDHAVEVIEVQTENREREAKGISPDTTRICNLYDISDWMFSAERVKSLLDELTEVYAQLTGYKAAMNDFHRLTRDLDVLLNGDNAAQQASLCDIVAQVQSEALKSPNHPDATEPVADVVAWHKEGEERTCDIRWRRHDVAPGPLYSVPQIPDEATPENIEILASTYAPRGVTYQWDSDECNAAADSWNACRSAMTENKK